LYEYAQYLFIVCAATCTCVESEFYVVSLVDGIFLFYCDGQLSACKI